MSYNTYGTLSDRFDAIDLNRVNPPMSLRDRLYKNEEDNLYHRMHAMTIDGRPHTGSEQWRRGGRKSKNKKNSKKIRKSYRL